MAHSNINDLSTLENHRFSSSHFVDFFSDPEGMLIIEPPESCCLLLRIVELARHLKYIKIRRRASLDSRKCRIGSVPLSSVQGGSWNEATPTMDGLQWKILWKWMIRGYPYFRNPLSKSWSDLDILGDLGVSGLLCWENLQYYID